MKMAKSQIPGRDQHSWRFGSLLVFRLDSVHDQAGKVFIWELLCIFAFDKTLPHYPYLFKSRKFFIIKRNMTKSSVSLLIYAQ